MSFDWESRVTGPADRVNPYLGRRLDSTGRFLPEQGNTIVQHVLPGSPTEAALVDLRAGLMALPCAGHFAFTDIASYHMTVFEGIVETRRSAEYWPADIALDQDIGVATAAMAAKLQDFAAPPRFAVTAAAVTPFGLSLTPVSAQDEQTARAWRDWLAQALGMHSPGHAGYRFHTTLAYVKDWLPAEALPDYRRAMADLGAAFNDKVKTLDIGPPAFCRFNDMNAFNPVLYL